MPEPAEPRPNRNAEPDDSSWMSIGDACKFLGVDPSTLRRWSNEGRLPVFTTPGGHRRYAVDDLRALVAGTMKRPARSRVSRQELTNRSLSAYADDYLRGARDRHWFRAFGEASQEELRQFGRKLVDLAIRYAAMTGHQAERDRLLVDGKEIGEFYGRAAAQAGLAAGETVEAFLYFRYPVVRAVLAVIEEEGLPARRASRLFIGIDDFIDQVLLAMLAAYERTGPRQRP